MVFYGLNGAWCGVRMGLSVFSSTVKKLSNLEMPHTVIVRTIALCHGGVGAVVPPVFFISRLHLSVFVFFLPLFSLIGCCDHAY